MILTTRVLALAVLLLCAACAPMPRIDHTAGAPSLAVTRVSVVDVESGRVLPEQTVLIAGNRIRAVEPTARIPVPSGTQVVDGSGKFMIPGLWDMHTHVIDEWRWGFPLYIANGVTGVRDLATNVPLSDIRGLRRQVADGTVLGPRFLTPGPLIDGPTSRGGRYRHLAPATAEEGRAVVDSLQREGADFIKVYDNTPRDVFHAIVASARSHGLDVVGHVPLAVPSHEAISSGLRSVEHASYLRTVCLGPAAAAEIERMGPVAREAIGRGDTATLARLTQRADSISRVNSTPANCAAPFLAASSWLSPTLMWEITGHLRPAITPEDSLLADPLFRYVPGAWVDRWRGARAARIADDLSRNPTDPHSWRRIDIDRILTQVGHAHRGGAGILAGTDGGMDFQVYGFNLHDELQLLVRAGLTPLQALQTATLNPARFLRATDSLGTVEPGKLADLAMLDANPLEDIGNTQKIRAVVLNGRYLDRQALDALLVQAESVANAPVR